MPWVRAVRVVWPRFIGVCEVLGALGLILPGVTHIQTWLTVVAAGGLAMIVVDAAMFHRSRTMLMNKPLEQTTPNAGITSFFNGELSANPFPFFAQLRELGAVVPIPFPIGGNTRAWMVTHMEEAVRILKDHEHFTVDPQSVGAHDVLRRSLTDDAVVSKYSMVSVDEPDHLGWKLAQVLGGAPDSLLDTYQAERLPVAAGVLASSSLRHREFERDFNQALGTLFAGKETFADPTQLSLTYRGSSLARDLDDATGIRAGDRAPDVTCVRAGSGEQVRLYDLFRGPHFTLLVFGDQPTFPLPTVSENALRVYTIARRENTGENANHTLVESEGQASRAYGIRGDALILIRPDGYIGLTGGTISQEPLIDYLREVIGWHEFAETPPSADGWRRARDRSI